MGQGNIMIKLKCKNKDCGYSYEVTEKELEDNSEFHKICFFCGEKNEVTNLEEIIQKSMQESISLYLDNALNSLGIEGTIEAIEHLKEEKLKELYMIELKKRGMIR